MNNCIKESTLRLLEKGYIGKQEVDGFMKAIGDKITETRENLIRIHGDDNPEMIDALLSSAIDVNAIRTSLNMALKDRQIDLVKLYHTEEAQKKAMNMFVATSERMAESGNKNAVSRSTLKVAINSYATNTTTVQSEIVTNFFDNTKIRLEDGTDLDLLSYTSSQDGRDVMEHVLIEGSTEALEGVDKSIMDSVKKSEEKVDKLISSAFGKNAKVENVFKDGIYKSIVREVKAKFLWDNRKMSGLERFSRGTNLYSGNLQNEWKEHLKLFIKDNLINKSYLEKDFVYEQMTNANFKKKIDKLIEKEEFDLDEFHAKKLDIILEDLATKLDAELGSTVSTKFDTDSVNRRTSTGLFSYLGYSDYLDKDSIKLYKDYKIDVIDTYQRSVNEVARKYGILKTWGEEPKATLKTAVNKAKEITTNPTALSLYEKEYSKRLNEVLDWELGSNYATGGVIKALADGITNFAYSGNLILVGMAQFNDTTTAYMRRSNIGRSFNPKDTVGGYVRNLYYGIVRKFKGDGIIKDTKDLMIMNRMVHLFSDSTFGNKNIKFANTNSQTYLKNIKTAYKEKGVTGSMLEATTPISIMDIHTDSMNITGYKASEEILKEFKDWKDESTYKKVILSGNGFNEKTYDTVAKYLKDKFSTVERMEKTINDMSYEDLESMYFEFSENDYANLMEIATNKAKFKNKYINYMQNSKGVYGSLNNLGIKKLFEHVNDFYNSQTGSYKEDNWIKIFEDKKMLELKQGELTNTVKVNEKLNEIIKFYTVTGTEMRVQIDKKAFEELFVNKEFASNLLKEINYESSDISNALARLRERMEKDLNVGYIEMVKNDVEKEVYKAIKTTKNKKQEYIDFRKLQMEDEKFKKLTLDKFRAELQNRFENSKTTMANEITKQEPDVFERVKSQGSDIEYAWFKAFRYMKNSLMRSTAGMLDLIRFSRADIYEKGGVEILHKVAEAGMTFGVATLTGCITALTTDILDGQFDAYEEHKEKAEEMASNGTNFTGKQTMLELFDYGSGGYFVGTGLNPTKLIRFIEAEGKAIPKNLELTDDFLSGDLDLIDYGKEISKNSIVPIGKLWVSPRVKDLGEGALHINDWVQNDLME